MKRKSFSYLKSISMNKFLHSDYWVGFVTTGIGYCISFIMPVWKFLLFIGFLVVADLISGTRAALKRGEKLHSRGFSRTVEKIGLYAMVILLSRGLTVVFELPVDASYYSSVAIAITEFKSMGENVFFVTGVNFWEYIKGFLTFNKNFKK